MCYAGTVSEHLKESNGGESDVLNHYMTSYKSSYNQHWDGFKPRIPQLYGSGYVSNHRPVIQYRPELDDLDNPKMKNLLESNYKSLTQKDYVPYFTPKGTEVIPALSRTVIPDKYETAKLKSSFSFVNEKLNSTLVPILPKRNPELLKHMKKTEAENENFGFGPSFGSTTYKSSFGPPSLKTYDLSRTNLGRKEETGCTRNIRPEDTLTGRPDPPHLPGDPRWKTARPIGVTEYNDEYTNYSVPDGREQFPRWTKPPRSTNLNSFVKQTKLRPDYVPAHPENVYNKPEQFTEAQLEALKKKNPTEYQNVIHGFKEPSVEKGTYQGLQREPKSKAAQLGRRYVGPNESTGFTINEAGHIETDDRPPDRFVTHYMSRYYPPPPTGKDTEDREGHIHFNTQSAKRTAIACEAQCSKMEPQIPATSILGTLPPYQARSLIARDTIPQPPTKNCV